MNSKRTLLAGLLGLLGISLLVWTTFIPQGFVPTQNLPTKLSKFDRIDLAIQQEVEMTRDPALGIIPRERLVPAYQQAQRQRLALKQNVSRTAIEGMSWQERGPDNVAGRVRTILIDANDPTGKTIWTAGVAGGLWKSTDITASDPVWVGIDDFFENMAITAMAQHPTFPDTLYFGTGEGFFNIDAVQGLGIWRSADGGNTWTRLMSSSSFEFVQKLLVLPNGDLFACTRNFGIQRSTDGGQTWNTVLSTGVNSGTSNRAADLEVAANGDLWAGLGLFDSGGLYKSTDGGTVWTRMGSTQGFPITGYARVEIACAPSNVSRVYVLLHDLSDNDCLGIYRSDDAGLSWSPVDNPAATGMSNFCRNQGWYNLIAAVDPNDDSRVFIGGIDLLVSNNAGSSWTQISQWGGGAPQYVHADQHAIVFEPGNSDIIYFGNDGGLYRTTNGTSPVPVIVQRNEGLNITQFYAAAITPTGGLTDFLGGSQDNGTQRYQQSGLNSTTQVTSGDGGFCHIDGDEANVQLSSTTYNNYRISEDSWASFTSYSYGSSAGKFINPTDYDDVGDRLYASYTAGQYLYLTGVGNGAAPIDATNSIADFGGGQVSSVTVSPNLNTRVFFGLDNGRIVRVDNAHTGTPTASYLNSGAGMPVGGYVSSIAVEKGDDDHLLVTFSNYGVNSVWETQDGGAAWRSVEGNLPDMPIRWGMFHPFDPNQALLATELGVWSTDNLSESPVDWDPSNNGLANVRTDMLQFREADSLLLAATHGRGMFTSEVFREVQVRFATSNLTAAEGSADGVSGTCEGYNSYIIPVEISRPPASNVQVEVQVSGASTASAADYHLVGSTTLTFPAGDAASQSIELRVFEDGQFESGEQLVLQLNLLTPLAAKAGDPISLTIDLEEAEPDISQVGVLIQDTLLNEGFEGGILPAGWSVTHAGVSSDNFQIGTAGTLSSPPNFDIPDNGGFFAATNDDACNCDKSDDQLISPSIDLSQVSNPSLKFDAYLQVNTFFTEVVDILASTDGGTNWSSIGFLFSPTANWTTYTLNIAGLAGNSDVRFAFQYQDGSTHGLGFAVDNVLVEGQSPFRIPVANQLSDSDTHELGGFETIYFYKSDGELLAEVENLSNHDYGCVSATVDRAGTGTVDFWDATDDGEDLAAKTFRLIPENNSPTGSYRIRLYYTQAEITGWEAVTGKDFYTDAFVIKNPGAISNVTPANPYPDGPTIEQSRIGAGTFGSSGDGYIEAIFSTGFSGFGTGDPGAGVPFPVEVLDFAGEWRSDHVALSWQVADEISLSHYEIEKKQPNGKFAAIGTTPATGAAAYSFADRNAREGTQYYRLKSIDLDGSYEYSRTVSVSLTEAIAAWQAYPNPFKAHLHVQGPEFFTGKGRARLYQPNGAVVWQGELSFQAGYGAVKLDPSQPLPSGMYLLEIRLTNGERTVLRVLR